MEAAGLTSRDPRKNLMLAAQIAAGDVCAPVRIRNMSVGGAMIDGAALPRPGARFLLRRLELSIGATAVWTNDGRCGLRLAGQVDVDEWIGGVRKPERGISLAQSRVDRLQAALRNGESMPDDRVAPQTRAAPDTAFGALLARELEHVRAMLDAIGEELSDNVEVLMKHEQALQNLDIAKSIVESLSGVVAANDRGEAVAAIAMHDLRSRMSGVPSLT